WRIAPCALTAFSSTGMGNARRWSTSWAYPFDKAGCKDGIPFLPLSILRHRRPKPATAMAVWRRIVEGGLSMTRRRRPKATEQNDGTRPNVSHDPLRHWSVDVDPAVMSGDQWVDEDHDFGHTAIENKEMEK